MAIVTQPISALYALAPTLERFVYHDITTVEAGEQAQSLNSQAAAAQASAPNLTVAGMRPATAPTDSTRVYFSDPQLPEDTQRAVFVNPYTGQVLGSESVWFGYLPLSTWLDAFHRNLQMGEPGSIDFWRDYSFVAKLADWGIRAHMGLLFGPANHLLLLAVAVGLITVILRGYRMWWQRRPTRGSSWALGRPPLRGGIRQLPPAAIAGIAAAAVAIGWFLPLLGLSLAAFLAVDALIGLWKARTGSRS